MKTHVPLILLSFLLAISSCHKGDDSVSDKLDCPTKIEPVRSVGGFLLPNGFTPNGDGRNDRLRLIIIGNDSLALRSAEIRISDSAGNLLYTITQPTGYWNGLNPATSKAYPTGVYRVDYIIVIKGKGGAADVTVSGHNCIWLFGPHPTNPTAVQAPKDLSVLNYIVFEEMVDPSTLTVIYTTGENFDN